MIISLNKVINKNQINNFIISSFFLIFLSYILSKGFIINNETSDKIFLITSVISIEIIYLLISNKYLKFKISNYRDYFLLLFFFIFNYIIWNSETLFSYIDLVIFLLFILFCIFNFSI